MEDLDKLRSLFFQEAELFFSIYDKDLNCLDVNEAFAKLFRCERKDLIGKNLCEISPDLKPNGRYDLYKEVIRTGNPIVLDSMQPHPTIGNYYFRIKAFRLGEGLGLLVKDITDLVESVQRFNYSTKASKEIIYEWNMNDNSIWFNEAYYELTALENKGHSMPVESWTKFIHPEDIGRVDKSFTEFIKTGGNYWSSEYRFMGNNNTVYYFAERAYVIRDRAGKPAKVIASVTDITHWQLNINHLEELLFALSHKVRLPVANILGVCNLLDNDLLDEKELKTIIGYMKVSVNSLDTFVRETTSSILDHKQRTADKNWA
ncbi:MAG: PAS domain-containing protein [Bacteroidia bacterium]|nr:PAS domain-containing protein [Bacteroidia bacterium]